MNLPPLRVRFERQRTVFLAGSDEAFALQVEPVGLAHRCWPHGQPNPLQLEWAIDEVESAIEAAKLEHADRGVLLIEASAAALLPKLGEGTGATDRDAVESWFSELVAQSHRAAAERESVPPDVPAAALLLLRELMHHLGFTALSRQS